MPANPVIRFFSLSRLRIRPYLSKTSFRRDSKTGPFVNILLPCVIVIANWRAIMKKLIILSISLAVSLTVLSLADSFRDKQQDYPRVRTARLHVEQRLDSLYKAHDINRDSLRIFIRVFKRSEMLEVWAANEGEPMSLLRSYDFAAFSGGLGPKRRQGDRQIPEGIYYIDRFNPASSYHLSLGLNYPNKSDRKRATSQDPGGDIFIHGNAVTIGCIPIGDAAIEELYTIAVDARAAGQTHIPVHIFPFHLTDEELKVATSPALRPSERHRPFWLELKPIYDAFERTHRVLTVDIDADGVYRVSK